MKQRTIFLIFMTVMLWACSNSSADSPSSVNAIRDPGQAIFKKHCVLCHGVKGNLQLNGAKVLGESVLAMEERIEVITNGRNAMTPFGQLLTPEEIRLVANYTFTFKGQEQDVE